MNEQELIKIGEWLNSKGYCINLSDDFWMEEMDWGVHKTREIAQLLFDYHTEQCNIANVVGRSEQLKADEKPIVKGEQFVADYVAKHGKDLTSL